MSDKQQPVDRLLERLAEEESEAGSERTPSRLKARIYSALVRRQEETGPLRRLDESRSRGIRPVHI